MTTRPPAHSVERFRRCLLVGNPVTIKLASKELLQIVPHLSPMDLVNAVKIAGGLRPHHQIGADEIVDPVIKESMRRKWKKFNNKDFAILLSSLGKSGSGGHTLPTLIPALVPLVPAMRPSDVCLSLWGITRIVGKADHAPPTESVRAVFNAGMDVLTRDGSVEGLTLVNLTQLLFALSKNAADLKHDPTVSAVTGRIMRVLANPSTIRQLPDDSVPFILYAASEIAATHGLSASHAQYDQFFELMSTEVSKRITLKPKLVVDSVRALGRIRRLDRQLVEERLIPVLSQVKLTPEQICGLTRAFKGVGLELTSFI